MPVYCYVCDKCHKKQDEFRQVHQRNSSGDCECGGVLLRDRFSELDSRGTGDYRKPIEMYSFALNPGEISAFQRANPDIRVDTSGPLMGIPVAANRQQKKRALQYMGFVEKN